MPKTIKCDLHIVTDAEGTEHVLPTERDLHEARVRLEQDVEFLRAHVPPTKGKGKSNDLDPQEQERLLLAAWQSLKAKRDAWMPKAELRQYRLKLPTWAEWIDAEEGAKEVNPTDGQERINLSTMMTALLPDSVSIEEHGAVRSLSPDEVRELSPIIGRKLWDRVYDAVNPHGNALAYLRLPESK